jgi:hypothetical protein
MDKVVFFYIYGRRSLSCGNRCHSSRILFVNSAIFWHCGLRWFTLRARFGFISGDMTGHWNMPISLLLSEFSYC